MKIETAKVTSFVERFETMAENEKADKKTWREQAEGAGLNVKALKAIVRERKRKADPEADAAMDAYRVALGMAVDLVSNGDVSLREASRLTGASKSSIHRALAVPALSREMVADDLGEIESCGSTEGRAGRLVVPNCQPGACDQTPPGETHKDRKTAGTPAMAASGTAGVESCPQEPDTTLPAFLDRRPKQDAEASVSPERSEAVHA